LPETRWPQNGINENNSLKAVAMSKTIPNNFNDQFELDEFSALDFFDFDF